MVVVCWPKFSLNRVTYEVYINLYATHTLCLNNTYPPKSRTDTSLVSNNRFARDHTIYWHFRHRYIGSEGKFEMYHSSTQTRQALGSEDHRIRREKRQAEHSLSRLEPQRPEKNNNAPIENSHRIACVKEQWHRYTSCLPCFGMRSLFCFDAVLQWGDIISIAWHLLGMEGQRPIVAPHGIGDLGVGRLHRDAA